MRSFVKISLALGLALALGACKSELYSGLDERDANEMIAVLSAANISAARSGSAEGAYSVQVDGEAIAEATRALARAGLPHGKFETLGKVFESGGMVSTPFGERARYMYAIDQELSHSLSRIAGVASARVHVTIPEDTPLETVKQRPRASVFIYCNSDANVRAQIATIKTLIVNSVNGLQYEDVAVALFPTATSEMTGAAGSGFASAGLGAMGLLIAAALGAFTLFSRRGRKSAPVARRLA